MRKAEDGPLGPQGLYFVKFGGKDLMKKSEKAYQEK